MDPGARGFRVNLGDFVQSQQAVRINERAFVVGAAANIGDGIQDIGAAVSRVAYEQNRLINEKRVLEADGAMAIKQQDIARLISEEPDERKWQGIAEKEALAAEKLWMTDDLSPDARDAIMAKSAAWRSRVVAQSMSASLQKTGADVLGELEKTRLRGIKDGKRDVALAAIDRAEELGLRDPGHSEALRIQTDEQVTAAAQKSVFEAHFSAIATDPTEWKRVNPEPWPGDEANWQRLKNIADAREREIGADAVDAVQRAIIDGDIDVPEEIDTIKVKGLTPQLREALKGDLMQFDRAASDEEKRVNGDANWLRMWKAAREWQGGPSDKAAAEYHEMMRRVRYGVPDDQQGKIAELLYRKMGVEPKALPPAPEVVKAADKILDTYWGDGTFNGGKSMERMGADGYPEEDPAAVRNAAPVEATVRQKVNNYLKQNPNTKPEEVGDIVRRFLPDGVRSSLLRRLQSDLYSPQGPANSDAAQARPVSAGDLSLPVSGDLPDDGGSIDNSLLPQVPPFKAE